MKQVKAKQPPPRRLPDWNRATKIELDNYKSELLSRLQAAQIPFSVKSCNDINCLDKKHNDAADSLILDILLAVVEASYASVPLTGKAGGKNSKREIIPGWSREVEQFRLNSNAAYRSWLAAGSQGKALFTKPNCPHMPSSDMQFVGSNEPHNFTRHKVSSKQLWQVI